MATRIGSTIGVMIAATALIIGMAMVSGTSGDSKNEESSRQVPITVSTMTVRSEESYEVVRSYTGVIRAARVSEIGFERMAKLDVINVDEGHRVNKAQPLARLDHRNLEVRQSELKASKLSASALLRELTAGPRREEIAAAKAEVERLRAELQFQLASYERYEALAASNSIARQEYDRVRYEKQAAQAAVGNAEQKLSELIAGTRQERIEAQQAVVAQLEASLEHVALEIEKSTLKAPFTGVIARRYHDEGTIVSADSPCFRLIEIDKLEAWVGFPVDVASDFQQGEPHRFLIGTQTVTGRVRVVLPELDPKTRTRTVVFSLETAGIDRIAPSQIVRHEARQSHAAVGFWIPISSLNRGVRGLWTVHVVDSASESLGVVTRRDVEVLHTDGTRAFVRGMLTDGDCVVTSGGHRIVVGQRVTIAGS